MSLLRLSRKTKLRAAGLTAALACVLGWLFAERPLCVESVGDLPEPYRSHQPPEVAKEPPAKPSTRSTVSPSFSWAGLEYSECCLTLEDSERRAGSLLRGRVGRSLDGSPLAQAVFNPLRPGGAGENFSGDVVWDMLDCGGEDKCVALWSGLRLCRCQTDLCNVRGHEGHVIALLAAAALALAALNLLGLAACS